MGRLVREEGRKWEAGGRIEEGFAAEFVSSATYMATVATLQETGMVSWGGEVERVEVQEEIFDSGEKAPTADWQTEIDRALDGARAIYTDGSKVEGPRGMVGGGWFESEGIQGSVVVGKTATVWDGEIAGIRGALDEAGMGDRLLILTDSRAAIAVIRKAGRSGKARTTDLREVVNTIARWEQMGGKGTV